MAEDKNNIIKDAKKEESVEKKSADIKHEKKAHDKKVDSSFAKATADRDKSADIKAEKKIDDKSHDVKIEKKDSDKVNQVNKIDKAETKKDDGLEELPEDVKKKLEKQKAEKTGKIKKGKARKKKRKEAKKVSVGKAYIKATYNNTIVALTDLNGNVLSWASAGVAGFRGAKKSTPYAASIITRLAVGKAKEEYGLAEVSVFVKGVGTGRESAVRSLNSNGLLVTLIKDVTPVPHNGCRSKKPRRV